MRTALVTGANSGIGQSITQRFVRNGIKVYAGYRNEPPLEHPLIHPLKLDVTNESHIQSALELINNDVGPQELDILVNNAGWSMPGPLELIPLNDFKQQFEVNVFGLVRMSQVFIPLLRKARGRIINISSIAGRIGVPLLSAYSGSKFAVEGISDSLRRELAPLGIKVVLINPGPIETPIWKKSEKIGHKLHAAASTEILNLYQNRTRRLQKMVDKVTEVADSPEIVADAVWTAIQSKHPKARYFVGRGVGVQACFSYLLPDRLIDKLISLQMR